VSVPDAIAVTGIGLWNALGIGRAAIGEAVRGGRRGIGVLDDPLARALGGPFPLARAPEVDLAEIGLDEAAREALAGGDAGHIDTDAALLAVLIRLALDDARFRWDRDRNRVALVVAHENPGIDGYVTRVLDTVEEVRLSARGEGTRFAPAELADPQSMAAALYREHHRSVVELQTFMLLHRLARAFGCHGLGLMVNQACASGLYAVEAAARELVHGTAEAALVAAGDRPLLATKSRYFQDLGLLAGDGRVRPFGRDRHGFVLGDGGAALVLEPLARARARGAKVIAIYRGGGFNQEAWKVTLPRPDQALYADAMAAALARAEVPARAIDLVVPHGVATGVGDAYEARCLRAVFGGELERTPMLALKGAIGHNLGGSALNELAIGLLALEAGEVPPSPGCEDPDPALGVAPGAITGRRSLRHLFKCANGFAGFNAAVVFSAP
jgi:3-oxoacyl-(acyl-carrier-protein) synthase